MMTPVGPVVTIVYILFVLSFRLALFMLGKVERRK